MPRGSWKKGNKEDDFVVEIKQKQNAVQTNHEQNRVQIHRKPKNHTGTETTLGQIMCESFIEQFQKDYPYWIKKGNKVTCSLCSINVFISSMSTFKTEISTHMKSKRHKKKMSSYVSEEGSREKSEVNDNCKDQDEDKSTACLENKDRLSDVREVEHQLSSEVELVDKGSTSAEKSEVDNKTREQNGDKSSTSRENKNTLSDIVREVEYRLSEIELIDKKNSTFNSKNCLNDFETIYCLFEKDNPVTKASKKFIVKAKDGQNYYCTICQELIFDSMSVSEFRNNLYTHINDERHRERLPNFSKVESEFKKVMKKLFNKIPADIRGDLKYFDIGPVFRFVKCSLCNNAVSDNLHRIENHIKGKFHQKNKENVLRIYSAQSRNKSTFIWFRNLMSDMETQFTGTRFNEDLEYIHVGKMPGYVICSLCSDVLLPTYYYMKEHFKSDIHLKNKTGELVKWESTFETNFKKTQESKDYSKFEVSKYGLICHKCNVFMPATSYALYHHMHRSRCVNTLRKEVEKRSNEDESF